MRLYKDNRLNSLGLEFDCEMEDVISQIVKNFLDNYPNADLRDLQSIIHDAAISACDLYSIDQRGLTNLTSKEYKNATIYE